MTLVRVPLLSMRASGQLRRVLTYAESLGRPYVKAYRQPRNPRSPAQTAIRASLGFCQLNWSDLSAAEAESFADRSIYEGMDARSFFTSYNVRRWRSFKGLSAVYPATEASGTGWITTLQANASVRDITLRVFMSAAGDNWCLHFFRHHSAGFTQTWDKLHLTYLRVGTGWLEFLDGPLQPGTYYYQVAKSSRDGNYGSHVYEASATIV